MIEIDENDDYVLLNPSMSLGPKGLNPKKKALMDKMEKMPETFSLTLLAEAEEEESWDPNPKLCATKRRIQEDCEYSETHVKKNNYLI